MKVLVDTNVVLDVLLARVPHAEAATELMCMIDRRELEGVLCATTVTTIHYLATRAVGARRAREHVGRLLAMFEVAPVTGEVLSQALAPGFRDYEDAVLHAAARAAGANAIVSRNGKDFADSTLPVYSPEELLSALREAGS